MTDWLAPQKNWIQKRSDPSQFLSPIQQCIATLDFIVTGSADSLLVTDEQIDSQIAALNDGFGFLQSNLAKIEKEYQSVGGVDTRIRFQKGNIVRIPDPKVYKTIQKYMRSFARDNQYIFARNRISVIITDVGLSFNYLAQAIQPNLAEAAVGALGIVIDFRVFGSLPFAAQPPGYTNGYTLVHEMGHIFGLQHPFFNVCSTLADEQYIVDFPSDMAPYQDLVATNPMPTSCINTTIMASNFMDYSNGDQKMVTFTNEQAAFMHNIILNEKIALFSECLQLVFYPNNEKRGFTNSTSLKKRQDTERYNHSTIEFGNRSAIPNNLGTPSPSRQSLFSESKRPILRTDVSNPNPKKVDSAIHSRIESNRKTIEPTKSVDITRPRTDNLPAINTLTLNEVVKELESVIVEEIIKANLFMSSDPVTESQVSDAIANVYFATMNLSSKIVSEEEVESFFACLVTNLTLNINRVTANVPLNQRKSKFTFAYIYTLFGGIVCDCSPSQTCELFVNLQAQVDILGETMSQEIGNNIRDYLALVKTPDQLRALLVDDFGDDVNQTLQAVAQELFLDAKDISAISNAFFDRMVQSFVIGTPYLFLFADIFDQYSVKDSAHTDFYFEYLFHLFTNNFYEGVRQVLANLTISSDMPFNLGDFGDSTDTEIQRFKKLLTASICNMALSTRLFLNEYGKHFEIVRSSTNSIPDEMILHMITVLAPDLLTVMYNDHPESSTITQSVAENFVYCVSESVARFLFESPIAFTQMFNGSQTPESVQKCSDAFALVVNQCLDQFLV